MKIKSITRIKILSAAIIIAFSFNNSLFAQGKDKKSGGISGQVSALSKDFIAIVYRRDEAKGSEEEIALPLAKNVIIEHKKSLSEIAVGDMVYVEFDEMLEPTEKGERTKRIARVLSFVRAAPKKTESAILDSANPPEEKE